MEQATEPIVSIWSSSKIRPSGLCALGTLTLKAATMYLRCLRLIAPADRRLSTLSAAFRSDTRNLHVGCHDIHMDYCVVRSLVGVLSPAWPGALTTLRRAEFAR
jgi:hypothetical protein